MVYQTSIESTADGEMVKQHLTGSAGQLPEWTLEQ
jgi:hypothetical protein